MNPAPGQWFLKITGILMILMSVFFLIFNLLAFLLLPDASPHFLRPLYVLFVGIMGVKYCKSIEKATFLCVIGGLDFLYSVQHIIASVVGGFDGHVLAYLAGGLLFPILFMVGALKNHSAKNNQLNEMEDPPLFILRLTGGTIAINLITLLTANSIVHFFGRLFDISLLKGSNGLFILIVSMLIGLMYTKSLRCIVQSNRIASNTLWRYKSFHVDEIKSISVKRGKGSKLFGKDLAGFLGIDLLSESGKKLLHIGSTTKGFLDFVTYLEKHNIPGAEEIPKKTS